MNNVNITSMNTYPAYMNTYPVDYPNYNYPLCVKKIVRTIEKYGPYGEYLGKEIITEEYMEYIYVCFIYKSFSLLFHLPTIYFFEILDGVFHRL